MRHIFRQNFHKYRQSSYRSTVSQKKKKMCLSFRKRLSFCKVFDLIHKSLWYSGSGSLVAFDGKMLVFFLGRWKWWPWHTLFNNLMTMYSPHLMQIAVNPLGKTSPRALPPVNWKQIQKSAWILNMIPSFALWLYKFHHLCEEASIFILHPVSIESNYIIPSSGYEAKNRCSHPKMRQSVCSLVTYSALIHIIRLHK